jgi:hypothetical protein
MLEHFQAKWNPVFRFGDATTLNGAGLRTFAERRCAIVFSAADLPVSD